MPNLVYPQGLDRPIVGAVCLDPAYAESSRSGVAVGRFDQGENRLADWYKGPISGSFDVFTHRFFRWLGDAVVSVCQPGERLVLVAESTAFGPSIARKLGMACGCVEGLLIDLNAVEPRTRVDVSERVWRRKLGFDGVGRTALKRQALERARDIKPGLRDSEHDEAEALCIWLWACGAVER